MSENKLNQVLLATFKEGVANKNYSTQQLREGGYAGYADAIEAEQAATEKEQNMGQSLDKAKEAIVVAEIVHSGEKLILPEGVSLPQARDLITRRMEYEEEEVQMSESFDVFPWDGAAGLDVVLKRIYGWSPAQAVQSLFGKIVPKLIAVDVDVDKKVNVPWGQFSLPNISGTVDTSVGYKEGRMVFAISAEVKRKSEPVVQRLFNELREYLKTNSIYQGKAIKIRFRNDNGDALRMPEPKFMRTDDVDPSQLIYSRDIEASIETNLFTPIRRVPDLIAHGIPVKRGVLLGGKYGTGKTLAAKVASKYAVECGITFIYVSRADELADAINFAKQYQSPASVVFCEDIDRSALGEDHRTVEMDDILNIIDGIDSKRANIITVLTSNFMHKIDAAMLRPGRLDAVIDVKAPDGEAVQRLLRVYGGEAISLDEDLTEVGEVLDGHIPAVIAEVVKRAKLSQLRLNKPGEPITNLSSDALLEAATTMSAQLQLLHDADAEMAPPPSLDAALTKIVKDVVQSEVAGKLDNIESIVS